MLYHHTRAIPASPDAIYAAFADAARLARWWGPDGFTNDFHTFGFASGARWSYTMRGPDGRTYPNEMEVMSLDPPHRIVLHHDSLPRYVLTVTLQPTADGGALVTWDQEFENSETGRRLERIVAPANEQILDRLTAEVLNIRADAPDYR